MGDCCSGFIKYVLFVLNFVFWLAGVAILGVGIWLKVDPNVNNVLHAAGISIDGGATAFIVIGCIMFVMGFCGCCGAIKESKPLLGIYFAFVFIIFIGQVTLAIWGFASQSSLESLIEAELNKTDLVPGTDTASAVILIQSMFKCCGLNSGCHDWPSSNTTGCTCDSGSLLSSQCGNATVSGCTNGDQPGSPIYIEGCFDAIHDFIHDNIGIIAGIAIGIAVGEIFLMIATIIVCRSGRKKYETV